eukprot:TRINITY_DN8917_c1_g1_i5.p1 TRINITY_DN8917_c1_g1~~TRINITY_DN8917_c1_g1_i5.p1  ORF type:complete len:577 (-),score=67.07 TRINITY_DN8917_c1_g1_i5:248-1759(-)
MGPGTLSIDRRKFHGQNRKKLLDALKKNFPENKQKNGIVFLQGGRDSFRYSSDTEYLFEQESYFHYLFGVETADWFGAIHVQTGKCVLFSPKLPQEYAVWMGHISTLDEMREMYGVDEVVYTDEMPEKLRKQLQQQQQNGLQPPLLFLNYGLNSDSGREVVPASFTNMKEEFKIDQIDLFDVLTECRVTKSPKEIEVVRYCNRIGSLGHVAAMQVCKIDKMEYQLEATFREYCYNNGGCRSTPYIPICGSGPNAAILHYGHSGAPNDRQMKDGDIVLCDMGCQYYRYGSDITASYPVNGRFNQQQRLIYEAVLDAQRSVMAAMKPGIDWPEMHKLAERRILQHLIDGGLLTGDLDEMMDVYLGALFMPHGLGHLIGLDTHDVGGYPKGGPDRIMKPGLKALRTCRKLLEGMIITVEPGCYFIQVLLEPAFDNPRYSKFLDKNAITKFMDFGGVRLEDEVLVTSDGAESLTCVPRDIQAVERVMAGGEWNFDEEIQKRKQKYGF